MGRALSAEGKTCGAAGSGSHIGRGVRTEGAAGVRHTFGGGGGGLWSAGGSRSPGAAPPSPTPTPPGWLNGVCFCQDLQDRVRWCKAQGREWVGARRLVE